MDNPGLNFNVTTLVIDRLPSGQKFLDVSDDLRFILDIKELEKFKDRKDVYFSENENAMFLQGEPYAIYGLASLPDADEFTSMHKKSLITGQVDSIAISGHGIKSMYGCSHTGRSIAILSHLHRRSRDIIVINKSWTAIEAMFSGSCCDSPGRETQARLTPGGHILTIFFPDPLVEDVYLIRYTGTGKYVHQIKINIAGGASVTKIKICGDWVFYHTTGNVLSVVRAETGEAVVPFVFDANIKYINVDEKVVLVSLENAEVKMITPNDTGTMAYAMTVLASDGYLGIRNYTPAEPTEGEKEALCILSWVQTLPLEERRCHVSLFVSDGYCLMEDYLRMRPIEDGKRAHRFFSITQRLPQELQLLVCDFLRVPKRKERAHIPNKEIDPCFISILRENDK